MMGNKARWPEKHFFTPPFLHDWVDGGKDKGWVKEMLLLSLHGLLIYLCPILGNPCSRHLEAKAWDQAVCPKRIHYFR